MKHWIWLLFLLPSAAQAQRVGAELRLSPNPNASFTWQQLAFYASAALAERTLMRVELGFGALGDRVFFPTSDGSIRVKDYSKSGLTIGLGIDQSLIYLKKQHLELEMGLTTLLPLQCTSNISLIKHRIFDSNLGLRMGFNTGYARRRQNFSDRPDWEQLSFFNFGLLVQFKN